MTPSGLDVSACNVTSKSIFCYIREISLSRTNVWINQFEEKQQEFDFILQLEVGLLVILYPILYVVE